MGRPILGGLSEEGQHLLRFLEIPAFSLFARVALLYSKLTTTRCLI